MSDKPNINVTPETLVSYIKNPTQYRTDPLQYYRQILKAKSKARGSNIIGGPQVQLDRINVEVRKMMQAIRTTPDREVSLDIAKKCLDLMNRGIKLVDVTLSI